MCILYPAAWKKKDFQPASILEIIWKACEGSPHAGRCGGSKVCINTCRTWVALWTWHQEYTTETSDAGDRMVSEFELEPIMGVVVPSEDNEDMKKVGFQDDLV